MAGYQKEFVIPHDQFATITIIAISNDYYYNILLLLLDTTRYY